ncbi:response regulator [bacterium]|nr:response regulator [bacterium]
MSRTRIMLVDDHGVLRAGLKALFNAQTDFEVVAEAETTERGMSIAEESGAEVVILDLTLPGGGSLELAEKLTNSSLGIRILVLSMHDDAAYVRAALAAGATGYVVKTIREQDLIEAVRAVARGQVVVNLDDQAKTMAVFGLLRNLSDTERSRRPVKLSERETAVLSLLGQGHSNQEIAVALELSPKTVATYRARIGEKLGLRSTSDFVKYSRDNGLSITDDGNTTGLSS